MTIADIKSVFKKEFGFIENKVKIFEIKIIALPKVDEVGIYNPGVYVFFRNNEVLKVGRHLTNSRKRALEHIYDNTKNSQLEMKDLINCKETSVLLFNVKDSNDYHWVASIELFLEKKLNPVIRSARS